MTLGYMEHGGFRYYLHNGNPIYCHALGDKNSYRFILANLVTNQLCTIAELAEALDERRKNIERYAKAFREKGASYFFSRKEEFGLCYKLTKRLCSEIQSCLDAGKSVYDIAKDYNISESTIYYHIKKGRFKKTKSPRRSNVYLIE
jgi:DNA-binding NarL/FixJ family response regulator